MVMNYIEASKGARGLTPDHKKGVDLMNKFAKNLEDQGLLPHQFSNKDIIDIILPQNLLKQTVKEFNSNPRTPELMTKTFQTIWSTRSEALKKQGVNIEFTLPNCSYTQEEIQQLEKEGKRIGYLPEELSNQENRYLLGLIFPKMQSYSCEKDNSHTNNINPSGWFDYEASIDAPYRDKSANELKARIKKQKRQDLTINQYIVAGQDSKLFTGHYLDEGATLSWITGSRGGRGVVYARFYPDGDLRVASFLSPGDLDPVLGGRSAGVPKKV